MKKTYQQPTIIEVILKMRNTLLAGSAIGSGISNMEATGDALSRRGGFWDDEDDEY